MRLKGILFSMLIALSAFYLSGCGGGGSAGAPAGAAALGTVSTGTITSISTNSQKAAVQSASPVVGVEVGNVNYQASGASIVMDADDPDDAGLQVGMVVTVTGQDEGNGRGIASRIEYECLLKGPVSGVDTANNQISVLGQTVSVDSNTVYAGVSGLSGLAAGDMIIISGLPGTGGTILATRVLKMGQGFVQGQTPVKLKGTVSSVSGQGFTIGSLTVNSRQPLPEGLAVGSYVRVRGTLDSITGPLSAVTVEIKRGDGGDEPGDSETVHMEGLVANFVSPGSFTVDGINVNAGSLNVAGVANNVRVLVIGEMEDGVLVASRLMVLSPAPVPPTPNPAPGPSPSPDGAALYAADCASCHGPLASSGKMGATAPMIQSAISSISAMSRLSLTSAQINAIAAALAPNPAPAPAPTPTPTPAPAMPAAPMGVMATGGTNQVTISWSPVSGATSYNIYWSTASGVTVSTGTKISSATSPYIHAGLSAGTAYYYIVTAVNSAGESAASPQVSAATAQAAIDGAALYAADCASCHGPLASSGKHGATASMIQTGISSISAMNHLSTLTSAQIQAIATALQ